MRSYRIIKRTNNFKKKTEYVIQSKEDVLKKTWFKTKLVSTDWEDGFTTTVEEYLRAIPKGPEYVFDTEKEAKDALDYWLHPEKWIEEIHVEESLIRT